MVMMNLTRNDGTEPATFVTARRAPVEMAVTIEDSEDDRLVPALATKSVSVGFRAVSYTHLDVYKRQRQERGDGIIIRNEEKRRDDGDDELNEERRHGTGHIRYRAQSACGERFFNHLLIRMHKSICIFFVSCKHQLCNCLLPFAERE